MKKAEQDLARLRRERDQAQKTVEQLTVKVASERKSFDELQALANNREELIKSLHEENNRLKGTQSISGNEVATKLGEELEEVYKAYQSLDDQCRKKIFDLHEKEDLLLKLQLEVGSPFNVENEIRTKTCFYKESNYYYAKF